MIVNSDGLRYVKDYEECTVSSTVSVQISNSSYEWKIPFEKYSTKIELISCELEYQTYFKGKLDDQDRIALTLNSTTPTRIKVDTDEDLGYVWINLFLKNTEDEPNFIIEISGDNNSSNYQIELKADVFIKYKAEVYDLKVEDNQANIGKNLSVWGDASIGGDVSIGGSLTVPSDKGIEIGELTGGKINIGTMTGGEINVNSMCGGSIKIVHPKVSTTDEDYFGKVKFDFDIFSDKHNLIELTIDSVTKDGKAGGYIKELEDYHLYFIAMTINNYDTESLFFLGDPSDDNWTYATSTIDTYPWTPVVIEVHRDYDRGFYFFPYKINGKNEKVYFEESDLEEISLYKLPIWLTIHRYDFDSFD